MDVHTRIGKDDISNGSESFIQIRLHDHVHVSMAGVFNPNANDGDQHGREDGDETRNGQVADLL